MRHMQFRSLARSVLVLAVAIIGAAGELQAQASDNPINDLLGTGKGALNDLKFPKADSIAHQVLALGPQVTRSQKILAWQIIAAAQFPEEGGTRDTAAASLALRQAIQLDLDAVIPLDIRWSGLEALRVEQLRTTPSMAVRVPKTEISYGGTSGDAIVRVATSVPSTVWLLARAENGGNEITLDSASATTDAALRVHALNGLVPVLASGTYQFVVRARASTGGEVLERSLQATVVAAPLELQAHPAPVDTTKFLPERSKSSVAQGVATGLVVAAFTIAVNTSLRGNAPIKQLSADSRGALIGVLLGAGTIAAVVFDPGKVISKNRDANARLRTDATQRLADVTAENDRRVTGYRAKLTLVVEDK